MHNQYPSDKSLSSIFDLPTPSPTPMSPHAHSRARSHTATYQPTATSTNTTTTAAATEAYLRSPTVPSSPAPAYTALPDRNVNFHFAPLLEGRIGDIELETVDGKRFLVHRKVLEAETVFFHIYYGFVPVWRLNGASSSSSSAPRDDSPSPQQDLTIPVHQSSSSSPSSSSSASATAPTNRTLSLSRTSIPAIPATATAPSFRSGSESRIASGFGNSGSNGTSINADIDIDIEENININANFDAPPPPVPPKDTITITAPTPTSSPYSWVVPETSIVLLAFLSLIYPRGIITRHPEDLLDSLEMTGRVIRAALGYQSSKALAISRDRLGHWTVEMPVQTYAMACFFKFKDLIRLSSGQAVKIPFRDWPEDAKVLIGRTAINNLLNLQSIRLNGMMRILNRPLKIDDDDDEHCARCSNRFRLEGVWSKMTETLKTHLSPEMELLELLEVDLREFGGCSDCLVLLGRNIQRCLLEARELPRSL
ncbi:uncharacterized protein I303_103557 [Kwoniella dejecticola CBS 10117]|uniref:BTB domain-containing protein n=1 Tax=Kwoniella dejecticola CBS 10117 TaxID=1296121 RepID=A0A1A6A729_9TREE|nr:uncharacterized protein I303_03579 [Kwoniella dejecticola CBS 10117]OBR85865.1 hypothetical protein I303_03579 [Kwoniella dejecticola CBS 10117]